MRPDPCQPTRLKKIGPFYWLVRVVYDVGSRVPPSPRRKTRGCDLNNIIDQRRVKTHAQSAHGEPLREALEPALLQFFYFKLDCTTMAGEEKWHVLASLLPFALSPSVVRRMKRQRRQGRLFTNFCNAKLCDRDDVPPVTDIFEDIKVGPIDIPSATSISGRDAGWSPTVCTARGVVWAVVGPFGQGEDKGQGRKADDAHRPCRKSFNFVISMTQRAS